MPDNDDRLTAAQEPPGPRGVLPGGGLLWFRRHPDSFRALTRYGDVVKFRVGPLPVFVLNHPDLVREVLVTRQSNFVKGWGPQSGSIALGEGLLTSEGPDHLKRRRLLQPAFHRDRIADYARAVSDCAAATAQSWTDGEPVAMHRAMMQLSMSIASASLFGSARSPKIEELADALDSVIDRFAPYMFPYAKVVKRLPLNGKVKAENGRKKLDAMADALIDERRANPGADLLSMLISARDEQGQPLSDREIRDELVTFFIAAHETTAVALAWAWRLLAAHPQDQRRMQDEVDKVAPGRLPQSEDLPGLGWTEAVLRESMRLFPPKWMLGRRAIAPCIIGGFVVPAGALVLMSPFVIQRDSRFFEEPDSFRPQRWMESPEISPFSYFPFGGGSRRCIGEGFAWMEGTLTLATIAQRWTFVPRAPLTFAYRTGLILRPREDLPLIAQKRTSPVHAGTT